VDDTTNLGSDLNQGAVASVTSNTAANKLTNSESVEVDGTLLRQAGPHRGLLGDDDNALLGIATHNEQVVNQVPYAESCVELSGGYFPVVCQVLDGHQCTDFARVEGKENVLGVDLDDPPLNGISNLDSADIRDGLLRGKSLSNAGGNTSLFRVGVEDLNAHNTSYGEGIGEFNVGRVT
jgi:hypothetical protein